MFGCEDKNNRVKRNKMTYGIWIWTTAANWGRDNSENKLQRHNHASHMSDRDEVLPIFIKRWGLKKKKKTTSLKILF